MATYKQDPEKVNWLIPISIILAGLIIAGSLLFIKYKSISNNATANTISSVKPEDTMPAVTSADHILGNINAPVIFVEYSDTDCPYCQAFMPTMHKIIDEYGASGKVAWVYRHFAFHPNAPKEAEASECVAELGGNDAFWKFIDLIYSKKDFTQTPYTGLDPSQLPVLAGSVGVDKVAFNDCLASGKYSQKVTDEYNDAVKAGASGTPFTVIVTRNGRIPVDAGAVPYDTIHSAVQSLLNEIPQ